MFHINSYLVEHNKNIISLWIWKRYEIPRDNIVILSSYEDNDISIGFLLNYFVWILSHLFNLFILFYSFSYNISCLYFSIFLRDIKLCNYDKISHMGKRNLWKSNQIVTSSWQIFRKKISLYNLEDLILRNLSWGVH